MALLGRGTHLFLIDDLNVTIDQNSFPFQYYRIFVDLLKRDSLSLYQCRVRARWKRDMRFLQPWSRELFFYG